MKWHFVQGSMESYHFESWSAPLAPPHFEKSGYASVKTTSKSCFNTNQWTSIPIKYVFAPGPYVYFFQRFYHVICYIFGKSYIEYPQIQNIHLYTYFSQRQAFYLSFPDCTSIFDSSTWYKYSNDKRKYIYNRYYNIPYLKIPVIWLVKCVGLLS